MQHFACGVVSCLAVFTGDVSFELPFDVGVGSQSGAPFPLPPSRCKHPSPDAPLPSQFFSDTGVGINSPESLPSLVSQSSHSSLPSPHHHQVCGTRLSPTSSTPSSTLGDVNFRKENSLPYSQCQQATPQNQEQRLRMESQRMLWTLVKEYGMGAAQGAFEQTVRELGVEMNHNVLALGARGHLPGRSIVSSWWVLKQFTPTLPNRSMLGSF